MPLTLQKNSLVLYKEQPAHIKTMGDKLNIELQSGKTVKVRPKDVTVLHPGPLKSLGDLLRPPPSGDMETAWELLVGETTSLAELAELIYDDYTPSTTWATWQLVSQGVHFKGSPDTIQVNSAEEVNKILATKEAKTAQKQAWSDFVERVKQGQSIPDEDKHQLKDVEDVALMQRDKSRLLRELNQPETRETAHHLLLKLGYWADRFNPYPPRFNLPLTSPQTDLPELANEERVDLTHLPAFAIDDAGSTDPDDALSLEGNRLWIHIADVAALITPDSPADIEARSRGANLYLPEGTVHMLPPQATQILALGLSDTSPALSFGLDLDKSSNVIGAEIIPSHIKVTRLSYAEAEAQLSTEPLRSLYEIAKTHQAKRQANGSIEIDLPEVKVRVIDDKVVIKPLPALKSRDLVREAMLMAGQALAQFAQDHKIPFPYTSQNVPDSAEEFTDTMSGMFARRRTLTRSQVKGTPGLHAGLGLDIYTQITSPLRRYADLLAHQQIRAYLKGDTLLDSTELLARIGTADAVNGSVRQAERLSNKHWTLIYLLNHPQWQGEGVLVEKRHGRGIIVIPEFDLETRIPLKQDIPLDSVIKLKFNQVNLPELEAHFRVIKELTN